MEDCNFVPVGNFNQRYFEFEKHYCNTRIWPHGNFELLD
jgi:hypothetical protein